MLRLFRLHQRLLFMVTVCMVAGAGIGWAFSVFFSSGSTSPVFMQLLDGKRVSVEKIERMVRFLSSSHFDLWDDREIDPNGLNDGVLEKDFLSTDLGVALAEKIFPSIKEELSLIVQHAKTFQAYRHPGDPQVSAESLWRQFVPEEVRIVSELLCASEVSIETFRLLCKAYLEQRSLPSFLLKRVLLHQEEQEPTIGKDENLVYADLSLLGFHAVHEFLGKTYITAVAQYIMQAAACAEKQGLRVSLEEVRDSLRYNLQEMYKKKTKKSALYDFRAVFHSQLRKLGMQERDCLDLWREVLLFRKWQQKVEPQIDPLVREDFYRKAKGRAKIELFSIPSAYQIGDFSSLLELEVYLQAIGDPKEEKSMVAMPKKFLPKEVIAKNYPELVLTDYVLGYAEWDVTALSSHITLKTMWNWQTSDEGWGVLQKKFPSLAFSVSARQEDRFLFLEQIDAKIRNEMDLFTRQHLAKGDAEKIQQGLLDSPFHQESVVLGLKGGEFPWEGIKHREVLWQLLSLAALPEDAHPTPQALEARQRLACYTEDGQKYYRIEVLHRGAYSRVLSFIEAQRSGILRKLVDKKISAAYLEARKKQVEQYRTAEGGWKPVALVREQVGAYMLSSLCAEIVRVYEQFTGHLPEEHSLQNRDFYARYRMLAPLQEYWQAAERGWEEKEEAAFLSQQWQLTREVREVRRSDSLFFPEDVFYQNPLLGYSPVFFDGDSGRGYFFRMIDRFDVEEVDREEEELFLSPFYKKEALQKSLQLLDAIMRRQGFTFS